MSDKKEPAKKAAEKKEKRPPLVTRYRALKADTAAGKKVLEGKSQRSAVYRAVAEAKRPPTFAEVMSSLAKVKTESKAFENCVRWYLNALRKDSLVKSEAEREERGAT